MGGRGQLTIYMKFCLACLAMVRWLTASEPLIFEADKQFLVPKIHLNWRGILFPEPAYFWPYLSLGREGGD